MENTPHANIQQPLENNVVQSPKKFKFNWKSFFIGIIVVIIIEIVAFQLFKIDNKHKSSTNLSKPVPTTSQVTTNSTANWKTYTDNNLQVSFEYPSDWQVDNSINGIRPINDYNPENIQKTGYSTSIVVKPFNGNIQTFITNPMASTQDRSTEEITSKKINNPFYTITQYAIKTNFPKSPYNGTIYQVTIIGNGNREVAFMDFSGSKTLLSRILNTFNFDNNPTISCGPNSKCLPTLPTPTPH